MEQDKTDSSPLTVNEGREESLLGDKGELEKMEETQNVKETIIRVLPVRAPSSEDLHLVQPLPLAPSTGPEEHQLETLEVASTSQGVCGLQRMPSPTAASSRTTSDNQQAIKACSSSLPNCRKLPVSLVAELLKMIYDKLPNLLLDLNATQNVPGAQTCSSISSATELLAEEMLTKVSAMLQVDADSQVEQLESEAKADMDSLAAEVIVGVIENILATWATLHPEAQLPGSLSCVRYFLSAVCDHVQTLSLLRSSRSSSSLSSGRSLGELLSAMPKTNVVKAVEQKLEEQFGPCMEECSPTTSSQSLIKDLITIPSLGPGHSLHSLASDLVNEVVHSVKSAVELLDNQPSSSRGSSYITVWNTPDFSDLSKEMVFQAASRLASASTMGESSDCDFVTVDGSVFVLNKTSVESLPSSLIRLLLVRSVDTVTTACRAIASEFCYRESACNIGLTKLQQLANEQMLACISKGMEELEIDEIVEGISSILDHSLILRHPEMSFSHIYRSLFIDGPPPETGLRTPEVQETLVFLQPQSPPTTKASRAHGKHGGKIRKWCATRGSFLWQAMKRAGEKLSRKPSLPRASPDMIPEVASNDEEMASTSAGQTTTLKTRSKWWSLPKKSKIFKIKFLKRKTKAKKPSAQEELPASAHVTPGSECGESQNLEQSEDHETNQGPPRRCLPVRMFRAMRKSIAKTFKMSGRQ